MTTYLSIKLIAVWDDPEVLSQVLEQQISDYLGRTGSEKANARFYSNLQMVKRAFDCHTHDKALDTSEDFKDFFRRPMVDLIDAMYRRYTIRSLPSRSNVPASMLDFDIVFDPLLFFCNLSRRFISAILLCNVQMSFQRVLVAECPDRRDLVESCFLQSFIPELLGAWTIEKRIRGRHLKSPMPWSEQSRQEILNAGGA